MNIIELEEGLHNLIATQPAVMKGENADVISAIKNILEAHKAFSFRLEEYPHQDILKVGLMNESSKLELNLVSYVCQILQERGINIMLYVPKYAAVYNENISKYIDEIDLPTDQEPVEEDIVEEEHEDELDSKEEELELEKYVVIEKNEEPEENQSAQKTITKKATSGRDYLMELLKK